MADDDEVGASTDSDDDHRKVEGTNDVRPRASGEAALRSGVLRNPVEAVIALRPGRARAG